MRRLVKGLEFKAFFLIFFDIFDKSYIFFNVGWLKIL
jgi:hypothetical protein